MQLYDFKMAPNARRVRIFVAEKGLDIAKIDVDLGSRPFRQWKNPLIHGGEPESGRPQW